MTETIYEVQQYTQICDDGTNSNNTYFLYLTVIVYADGLDNSGEVVGQYLTTNATAAVNQLTLARNRANEMNKGYNDILNIQNQENI